MFVFVTEVQKVQKRAPIARIHHHRYVSVHLMEIKMNSEFSRIQNDFVYLTIDMMIHHNNLAAFSMHNVNYSN